MQQYVELYIDKLIRINYNKDRKYIILKQIERRPIVVRCLSFCMLVYKGEYNCKVRVKHSTIV